LEHKIEHPEVLLFELKPSKGHFGGNKRWSGFEDTNGVAMSLHCNYRTMAAKANDKCSQDVIPTKAMKLSADEVKAYNAIIALDQEKKRARGKAELNGEEQGGATAAFHCITCGVCALWAEGGEQHE
jgi:hypothetical protein